MSSGKTNKTIEDIFRTEFEEFELTPRKSFWPRLSRKIRFREFMRFSPAKFNIWYAGVIITATVAILTINTGKTDIANIPVVDQPDQKKVLIESVQTRKDVAREVSKGSPSASEKIISVKREESKQTAVDRTAIQAGDSIITKPIIKEEKPLDSGIISDAKDLDIQKLVKAAPQAEFIIDNIKGCVPLRVCFVNRSSNYDSLLWEFGDGGYSKAINPEWIFDEAGNYEVKLIIFGSEEKVSMSRQQIEVYPLPEAHFEISAVDPMIPDEQMVFYNYSENSISWHWDFGDGETSTNFEPVHTYSKADSYSVKLIAVSAMGCVDSLIITNAFGANSCYLKFPNAFIQNNGGPTGGYYSSRTDMEAEIFHPVWSGVTEYNLRIYTRSGVLVFETSDINIGWDGYYRGQKSDPGVYIWKVRGVFKNGDPFVQGGDLTLIPRN